MKDDLEKIHRPPDPNPDVATKAVKKDEGGAYIAWKPNYKGPPWNTKTHIWLVD